MVKDYSRTVMREAGTFSHDEIKGEFLRLETKGLTELANEGVTSNVVHERLLDMRYKGQSFEIIVPYEPEYVEAFQSLHEKQYGHRNPDKTVEIVNVRLRSLGRQDKPEFEQRDMADEQPLKDAFAGTIQTVFAGREHETPIIDRDRLLPGNRLNGPAIITEYSSTIVVPPKTNVRVDPWSNLIMDLNE